MKEHYNYDEIYGTLLYHNKEDTERTYFIIDCLYWKFYRWMFMHGWKLTKLKQCEHNYLKGFEIKLIRQEK